jgi:hypothetical protein
MSILGRNVSSFTQSLSTTASGAVGAAKTAGVGILKSAGLGKLLRLGPSSEPSLKTLTRAKVSAQDTDWRVKLSIPASFPNDTLLKPLVLTGGLVFPYTPTILIQHTANYNSLQPVHTNYPFYNYQSSQIEDIVITGDFFCENAKDAQYWVAMLHFLRSVTKMAYGQSSNLGSPPPVIRLNGYGDFVFPNVPVVIRNFTVDLPADVDYIKTQVDGEVPITSGTTSVTGFDVGWAPVQSQVSITVVPVYSRAKTSQFNLNTFINGGYLGSGNSGGGFI